MKLGTRSTLHSLLAAQGAGKLVSASFQAAGLDSSFQLACLRVFYTALLPWVREGLSILAYSGREGPRESDQFQELPEALLGCSPSDLRSFPAGQNASTAEEMLTQHASSEIPSR